MADELRIADTTGLTYTCEVRALDGTLIGSPVSLTESASSGRYYGTMTGSAISDTTYDLFFIQNSIIEQAITRHWNGTKLLDLGDVPTAVEVRTEVDSNSTQLAAIVADTNELQTDDVPTLIAALPTAVENRTEMDSNSTQLAAIVADTNELQTDDIPTLIATAQADLDIITGADGVNLLTATQASIDAIETDTSTTIPATITTAQNDLDIITGADGVNLLTATQASIDAIEADTNELQTDDIPTLIATAQADLDIITGADGANLLSGTQASIDAIEADTNELQTDDVPTLIATAQADLDIITGATGVNLLAATQASIDAIEADTNELQTDDVPGLIAAVSTKVDTAQADLDIVTGADGVNLLSGTQASIDAIEADTNELQTDDVPGLIAALNDLSAAAVNAEVDTALADIHLDHLFAADYDPASKPGTATALLNELIGDDGGVSQFTANALELGPNSDYNLLQTTTIATLASQTSFTLTAGSADDDAYNNMMVVVTDSSTSTQKAIGFVLDYTGSTKTITLSDDPSVFTMAVGDTIDILAGVSVASIWTYATRTLTSSANVTSSSLSGSRIEIVKAVTFTNTWTGLTIDANWVAAYFTIKTDPDSEADSASIIQVLETNPTDAGDGLQYLNGGSTTASYGSLTVNQGAGTILATLSDDATVLLSDNHNLSYDLKILISDGTSQLPLRNGYVDVVSTPTRTI